MSTSCALENGWADWAPVAVKAAATRREARAEAIGAGEAVLMAQWLLAEALVSVAAED